MSSKGIPEEILEDVVDSDELYNYRPTKLQKIIEEREQIDRESGLLPRTKEESKACFGCKRDFGQEKADVLTKKLYEIFCNSLMTCPPETIYQKISNAHMKLFVERDPDKYEVWTVAAIRDHIENHMIHSRYDDVMTIRRFREMSRICADSVFRHDPHSGTSDFCAKKFDVAAKLPDKIHQIYTRLLESSNE